MDFQQAQGKLQQYIPSLDGLRAIAIIWVMLHNSGMDDLLDLHTLHGKLLALLMTMGWLGVQLFFALSGFLITGILLDAKQRHTPHLLKLFYMRRILRIFPVYYFFLLIIVIAASLTLVPTWLHSVSSHIWLFIFYINNWFEPFRELGLGHLWSLAVEEQYYLFWPFIVISLSRSRLYLACAFLIVIAIAFRQYATAYTSYPEMAYVTTIARVDALVLGSILAIILRHQAFFYRVDRLMLVSGIIALAYMLLILVVWEQYDRVRPGLTVLNQTMAALLFTSLIYYSLNLNDGKAAWLSRWLSISWLRSIGKYSYAMYIFHFPVALLLKTYLLEPMIHWFRFAGEQASGMVFVTILSISLFTTYSLAWISWRLVERPFLKMKRFFPMHTASFRR